MNDVLEYVASQMDGAPYIAPEVLASRIRIWAKTIRVINKQQKTHITQFEDALKWAATYYYDAMKEYGCPCTETITCPLHAVLGK